MLYEVITHLKLPRQNVGRWHLPTAMFFPNENAQTQSLSMHPHPHPVQNNPTHGSNPRPMLQSVITSYSIHYTKLYDFLKELCSTFRRKGIVIKSQNYIGIISQNIGEIIAVRCFVKFKRLKLNIVAMKIRITSYNVCYTKLLRYAAIPELPLHEAKATSL